MSHLLQVFAERTNELERLVTASRRLAAKVVQPRFFTPFMIGSGTTNIGNYAITATLKDGRELEVICHEFPADAQNLSGNGIVTTAISPTIAGLPGYFTVATLDGDLMGFKMYESLDEFERDREFFPHKAVKSSYLFNCFLLFGEIDSYYGASEGRIVHALRRYIRHLERVDSLIPKQKEEGR